MSQQVFFKYAIKLARGEKMSRVQWARELCVTERSITNFNKKLNDEYGVKIDHFKGEFGYYQINQAASIDYNQFLNFLQAYNTSNYLVEAFTTKNNLNECLIFHQNWDKVDWMLNFDRIIKAIDERKYISFKSFSFRHEKIKSHENIMVYWMKQNAYFRWYIIGFSEHHPGSPFVLGLDKINELSISDSVFERKPQLEKYRNIYEDLFGVYSFSNRKEEVLQIECSRFQANYLKTLPLHNSQKVEYEDDKKVIFKYYMSINHEFVFELMRQNVWNYDINSIKDAHPRETSIKVLNPPWLVDYFREVYKRAFYSYCDNENISRELARETNNEKVYSFPI